ncbi:hypothetical protein MRX96_023133 [Rhipicephalus microplus]
MAHRINTARFLFAGAIKFGSFLEKSECNSILKALSKCSLPFQCAHGRPSLMPIECWKPNLAALLSRLKNNVDNPEMMVVNTDETDVC